MNKKVYRLVSTSQKRVVESPFCLCGEQIAAFYLEEAALRMARALRESKWKTVYGCYAQPDGSFLIGLASARAGGRFRQKARLLRCVGTWKDDRSTREIIADIESHRTMGRAVDL